MNIVSLPLQNNSSYLFGSCLPLHIFLLLEHGRLQATNVRRPCEALPKIHASTVKIQVTCEETAYTELLGFSKFFADLVSYCDILIRMRI